MTSSFAGVHGHVKEAAVAAPAIAMAAPLIPVPVHIPAPAPVPPDVVPRLPAPPAPVVLPYIPLPPADPLNFGFSKAPRVYFEPQVRPVTAIKSNIVHDKTPLPMPPVSVLKKPLPSIQYIPPARLQTKPRTTTPVPPIPIDIDSLGINTPCQSVENDDAVYWYSTSVCIDCLC